MNYDFKIPLKVSLAEKDDLKELIYELRYNIYIEELGKKSQSIDHKRCWIKDDLDLKAELYALQDENNKLIGTMRINHIDRLDNPIEELYPLPIQNILNVIDASSITYVSRLMIRKDYRGGKAFSKLAFHAYQKAIEKNHEFSICNTRPGLVTLYEQLGYRRFCAGKEFPNIGFQIPMIMALKDYEHFRRIGSPLYRYKNRYKKIEHFKKIIIEQLCTCYPAINRLLNNEKEFWENAEDTLQKKENALFNGITKIESKNLLKFGTILECSAGEKIIKEEEELNELFILLKGYAEVSKNKGGKRICLALINPGDVIGEMAFLTNKKRSADVISITNSEVLVLTENFLEKCMNTQSKLISIFLLNLSRQLAQKLADTNDLVLKLSARVNE